MPDTVDDDGAEAPVLSVGYQKAKVEELDAFAAQARADATVGEVVVYDGVEEPIADLHKTVLSVYAISWIVQPRPSRLALKPWAFCI